MQLIAQMIREAMSHGDRRIAGMELASMGACREPPSDDTSNHWPIQSPIQCAAANLSWSAHSTPSLVRESSGSLFRFPIGPPFARNIPARGYSEF